MFGQAHSQAGILIEPAAGHAIDIENEDDDELIKFRNLVWLVPFIEQCFCNSLNIMIFQAGHK